MKQLATRLVPKVWGHRNPPPPFTNPLDEPLGEIWFDPPPELANLLVKFIFTDAALSVQVHPDDSHAPAGMRGKNECWYILDAEPGAKIAVGLTRELSIDQLRAAALDGSIEQELAFIEVAQGDFFSIPAGTIHAIGTGISLLEVQQNSDVTFRLYDYGRPRELHLEDGVRVARRSPYDPSLHRRAPDDGYAELMGGPFFRVSKLGSDGAVPEGRFAGHTLVVPLAEGISLAGEPLAVGTCTLSLGIDGLALSDGASLILVEDTSAA
tara:strand:+ start:5111 stop:5911 length:801 start_codon:yes stop_codon:yes gene_type:complete